MRPKGALVFNNNGSRRTRWVRAPFYLVSKSGLFPYKDSASISEFWFNGQSGYCFRNYFHALAYHLKIEAKRVAWAKEFHLHP